MRVRRRSKAGREESVRLLGVGLGSAYSVSVLACWSRDSALTSLFSLSSPCDLGAAAARQAGACLVGAALALEVQQADPLCVVWAMSAPHRSLSAFTGLYLQSQVSICIHPLPLPPFIAPSVALRQDANRSMHKRRRGGGEVGRWGGGEVGRWGGGIPEGAGRVQGGCGRCLGGGAAGGCGFGGGRGWETEAKPVRSASFASAAARARGSMLLGSCAQVCVCVCVCVCACVCVCGVCVCVHL
jgi:hypothetical protein